MQIKFLNPMISKRPKLQRQRKIFKQEVKNIPRANQMNINVATWGRLLKRSSPGIQQPAVPLTPPESNSYEPVPEDKPETPGETPDPQTGGLGGQRPLGLVQLPPETPPPPLPTAPPPVGKKRMTVTPPPVPPRLDPEEVSNAFEF